MLFNIFINDLLFVLEKSDIRNFADDNTLHSGGANLKTVLENLEHDATKLLYWFEINSMKANLLQFTIHESDEVEFLGLAIDSGLDFIKHIDKLCRNAQCKLHAVRRIRKYLNLWVDYMEIFFPG